MIYENFSELITFGAVVLYLLAAWAIVSVIQSTRAPQAIVAWALSLFTFPIVALPAYILFGRSRFSGYVLAHRSAQVATATLAREVRRELETLTAPVPEGMAPLFEIVRRMTGLPLTRDNGVDLLIDGDQAFPAMLEAIAAAKDYVLFQSYIVRNDATGRQFSDALTRRAREGVRVYFLYDEIGCVSLPGRYLRRLQAAGVTVAGFKTTRGPRNPWQVNFRNHRKIVVVDGEVAFVGGLNIGDEYRRRARRRMKRIGPIRDTHVRLAGPAVQMVQIGFAEDWYWAEHAIPVMEWTPKPARGGACAVVVRTGPADEEPVCELTHVQAFNSARQRLWLATGYFVPDDTIIRALQLAALRGVDVRVLIPGRAENKVGWIASFNYPSRLMSAGVKVMLSDGWMHQKVFLVDDCLAAVGSANMDNRSLHINFEVTAMIADPHFALAMEAMLLADFRKATTFDSRTLLRRPYWFRLAAKAANLAAPLL